MDNRSRKLCALLVCVLITIAFTNAHGALRQWHEAILHEPYGTMALPAGHVWPVVTTQQSTSFLGPTGFTGSGPGGYKISSGPEGQLAVAGGAPGGVSVMQNLQWRTLPNSTPGSTFSAAFGPQGSISSVSWAYPSGSDVYYNVFTGKSWMGVSVGYYMPSGYVDLVIDDYGTASILAGRNFMSQGAPGGAWRNDVLPISAGLDLAVSSNGLPGVVGYSGSSLVYLTYNPQTLSWSSDIVASLGSAPPFGAAAVCFDNEGHPGIAYATDGTMHFAINDGSGSGWADSVIGQFVAERASLAFDRDNNPVVCFSSARETRIEYDPVVVPEPLIGLLLTTAAGVALRKRRM